MAGSTSLNLECYALHRHYFHFNADLLHCAIRLRQLRSPLFTANFHQAAIPIWPNVLGDYAGLSNDCVYVAGLSCDVQSSFEPAAENGEVKQSKNCSADQSYVPGLCKES